MLEENPMDLTTKVVSLDDPLALDASKVGGKTAGLATFVHLLPVPTGFAVITEGFTPLGITPLATAQMESMLSSQPPNFWPVAVRSSGIGEDSAGASFAGQHETVLNVADIEGVMEALEFVVDSFYEDRAISYRTQKNLPTHVRDIKPSVLVQAMVDSDYSAVAFGKNVTTGSTDEITINMAPGLGEQIVSGKCNPIQVIMSKRDGSIIEYDGGEWNHIERPTKQLDRILHAIYRIEQTWDKGPVDMECAFIGNDFYLLQARPITI
jgi:pyruvate,water dikinase